MAGAILVLRAHEIARSPRRLTRLLMSALRGGYRVYRALRPAPPVEAGDFLIPVADDDPLPRLISGLEHVLVRGRLELEVSELRLPRVAIYAGRGTYIEGKMHASLLLDLGILDFELIDDAAIFERELQGYNTLIVPGGWGDRGPDLIPFSAEGRRILQRFVANGGGYLGTCAGAIFTGRDIEALDLEPALTYDLVDGRIVACFRGRGLVMVRVTDPRLEVNLGMPERYPIFHSGGFVLVPDAGGNARAATVFESLYKYEAFPWTTEDDLQSLLGWAPNMVVAEYGQGRVVALASHPEFQVRLKPGPVVFRDGGREYVLDAREVNFGYAVAAAALIYANSRPRGVVELEGLSSPPKLVRPAPAAEGDLQEALSGLSDAVATLRGSAAALAERAEHYRRALGEALPYADELLLLVSEDSPPSWYAARYRGFPTIAGVAASISKRLSEGGVQPSADFVSELRRAARNVRRAAALLRYVASLAEAVVEIHARLSGLRPTADELKRLKAELESCKRRGLLGRARVLEARLRLPASRDALKWSAYLEQAKAVLAREALVSLLWINREALGRCLRALALLELARRGDAG